MRGLRYSGSIPGSTAVEEEVMASMMCPMCNRLDIAPIEEYGILYYSNHAVKAFEPDVLCSNSGQPNANLEWFEMNGLGQQSIVVWPGVHK